MSKSRAKRRRASAQRLRRLEGALETVSPVMVGPLERMWRAGTLSPEQFWAGTQFAAAYDATLPAAPMSAADLDRPRGSSGVAPQEHHLDRKRLGTKYRQAVEALDRMAGQRKNSEGLTTVLTAAAIHKLALDAIDKKLKKRKQWSRVRLLVALNRLVDLWAIQVRTERDRAEALGATLV